jgi:hypothetical protein
VSIFNPPSFAGEASRRPLNFYSLSV